MTSDGSKLDEPDAAILAVLSATAGAAIALLTLAAYGPRLWATQTLENATHATVIVAVGLAMAAALMWPAWTGHRSRAIATIAGAVPWVLLAGRIGRVEPDVVGRHVVVLCAALLLMSLIRGSIPRRIVPATWCAIVYAVHAPAVLWLLGSDFSRR